MRPLALTADGWSVEILDQTRLPHHAVMVRLTSLEEVVHAIRTMQVRGAPLIGIAAAYGLALALRADPSDAAIVAAAAALRDSRPTAVNLARALGRMRWAIQPLPPGERAEAAYATAGELAAEEVAACRAIGEAGGEILHALADGPPSRRPLNILTHCNAGWLATLEHGTALAPVYRVHRQGLPVHVWVDETRPRNQGWLTAWELADAGVPHTVVADAAAGWLFRQGKVDLVLVGADRIALNGDVCNKVGTSLVALAAKASGVPLYVAAPSSTLDPDARDGFAIPIECRSPHELTLVRGRTFEGRIKGVQLSPHRTAVLNPAFDITPGALVTGLLTERGVSPASETGIRGAYPEWFQ